jgi:hypothetical protein
VVAEADTLTITDTAVLLKEAQVSLVDLQCVDTVEMNTLDLEHLEQAALAVLQMVIVMELPAQAGL